MAAKKTKSKSAKTKTSTYDDGTFTRTALVIAGEGDGSVDVVDAKGRRLCELNITVGEGGGLMVDVIDIDNRYKKRQAHTFSIAKGRETMAVRGTLVAVDFEP